MTKRATIKALSLTKEYLNSANLFGKSECFTALEDVSFTLTQGESLSILGEAGSGKSTLAKILVGAEHATSGVLEIDDKDVSKVKSNKHQNRNRRVRMVYQNTMGSLNPSLTIGEILSEPLINMTKLTKSEREERLFNVLELVGLKSDHSTRLPHTFSAGERQRIAIARALILDPVCIIADEPLSVLETSAQSQIVNLMLDLQKELNLSYIMISYNLDVVEHMCDKIMVLCRGRVVEYGATQQVLRNPKHPYTKSLLSRTQSPINRKLETNESEMKGCIYCDRCMDVNEHCHQQKPEQVLVDGCLVSCHQYSETNKKATN